MADLLSALVQRSKSASDPIAKAYTSGNRPYQVELTRPAGPITYNRDTQAMVNPADTTLYVGPGRFTTGSGPVELEVGGERQTFTSVRCSINSYDGARPRVDDMLRVLATPLATATELADRVFTVQSVEIGGHFDTGYVLTLLGIDPSRRNA